MKNHLRDAKNQPPNASAKIPQTEKRRCKMAKKKKKWIQEAIKRPGALRRKAGVKKGEKIPLSKLQAMAKQKGRTGRQARLALTLRKLAKKRKKK